MKLVINKLNKEVLLLIALLVGNFLTKIIVYTNVTFDYLYPSTLIKTILIALLLWFLFKNKQVYIVKKAYIYMLILIGSCLIGILFDQNLELEDIFKAKLVYLSRYLFLFLFVPFFINTKGFLKERIINTLLVFAIINTGLIFLGSLLDINLFKSYPNSLRFGYNGLLPIQGIGAYFYIFIITIVYYRYMKFKKDKLRLLLFIFGSLFLGTKAIYLYLFLLFFVHVHFYFNNTYFKIGAALSSLGLIAVFWNKILELSLKYISFSFVYEKYGLITYLTSTRDLLLEKAYNYIILNWKWINYLVGGINYKKIRVEFEPVDIFLFFGLIGVFTYTRYINCFFFKKDNMLLNGLLLIVILVSFLAGNLFSSITNSLFFAITFLYIGNYSDRPLSK